MEEIRLPKSLDDRCALEIKECYDNRLNVTGTELELLPPNVWVTNLCAFPSFRIIFANFFMRATNIGEHTIYNGIYDALRRVYIQRFDGITENLMMRFFGGALAMAIFCLNHHRPELYYSKYCELWQDNGVEDHKICEHISACMVYCILKYENDSRLQRILKDIQWRLKHSQNGINTDTLKMFEDAVAQSIGATEENTQGEEQPKADTPLEKKEEEAAPTLSDDEIKTTINTLQEEGYLDEKVRYLGVHKVLVNRGVCDNNLSGFGRYMVKLGFAEKVSYGKDKKRETTDIYEIIKKVPASFRDQRLSEWFRSREEQYPKHQKITDTAKRFSELIHSHKMRN